MNVLARRRPRWVSANDWATQLKIEATTPCPRPGCEAAPGTPCDNLRDDNTPHIGRTMAYRDALDEVP
jgi:hypothetical protein